MKTKIVRIPIDIFERVERKQKEMIKQTKEKGDIVVSSLLENMTIENFLGYLINKGLYIDELNNRKTGLVEHGGMEVKLTKNGKNKWLKKQILKKSKKKKKKKIKGREENMKTIAIRDETYRELRLLRNRLKEEQRNRLYIPISDVIDWLLEKEEER